MKKKINKERNKIKTTCRLNEQKKIKNSMGHKMFNDLSTTKHISLNKRVINYYISLLNATAKHVRFSKSGYMMQAALYDAHT